MSAAGSTQTAESYKPKARPQSILAQEFSAALDDLFKLNGLGELEESVVQKKDKVQTQRYQLEDLDAKLRETSERLRRLETKHRRHQSQMQIRTHQMHQQRSCPVSSSSEDPADNDVEDDSSGDSDTQTAPTRPRPQQGERVPR
ncbi:hypothetical protein LTR84_002230 [Exophiala bonariae]|uniref:Uncharacterized protein n=1 Tax=Exophiala bonariae TaxID=1690606 RepID=A0AAV9NBZ1_9EURO|nr:hypothetical protein LTR84_002230 [Exophiala bonariae]